MFEVCVCLRCECVFVVCVCLMCVLYVCMCVMLLGFRVYVFLSMYMHLLFYLLVP